MSNRSFMGTTNSLTAIFLSHTTSVSHQYDAATYENEYPYLSLLWRLPPNGGTRDKECRVLLSALAWRS